MTFWEFVSGERTDGTALVTMAGVLGGVVRWATLRSDWKTGLIGIVVGGISAAYVSPLVEPLLGGLLGLVTDDPVQKHNFAGFVVGIGGITISGTLMDIIAAQQKRIKSDADRDDPGK